MVVVDTEGAAQQDEADHQPARGEHRVGQEAAELVRDVARQTVGPAVTDGAGGDAEEDGVIALLLPSLQALPAELTVLTHRPPPTLAALPADELILRHPLLVVPLALLLGQQLQLLDDALGPLLVLAVLSVYVGGEAWKRGQSGQLNIWRQSTVDEQFQIKILIKTCAGGQLTSKLVSAEVLSAGLHLAGPVEGEAHRGGRVEVAAVLGVADLDWDGDVIVAEENRVVLSLDTNILTQAASKENKISALSSQVE